MAELAASLIGIASFGVALTTNLYEFGATTAAAKQQTDFIARHVRLFGDTLELLGNQIDEDQPIHSSRALDLVYEIEDQSYHLFHKIQNLLPNTNDRMRFMQKVKWNFRKTKVEVLVAELEYLKSTVHLLVTVLYAGKKIRSHRRKKRSKAARDEISVQCAKVKNAIVEQFDAATIKENLHSRVEDEEEEVAAVSSRQQILTKVPTAAPLLQSTAALTVFRTSLGQASNASEQRSLVLQGSVDLLRELLSQWTTLADQPEDPGPADQTSAEPSKHDVNKDGKLGDEGEEYPDGPNSSRDKRPAKSQARRASSPPAQATPRVDDRGEVLTQAFLEARERETRMAEELEKLKLEKRALEERVRQADQRDRNTYSPAQEKPDRKSAAEAADEVKRRGSSQFQEIPRYRPAPPQRDNGRDKRKQSNRPSTASPIHPIPIFTEQDSDDGREFMATGRYEHRKKAGYYTSWKSDMADNGHGSSLSSEDGIQPVRGLRLNRDPEDYNTLANRERLLLEAEKALREYDRLSPSVPMRKRMLSRDYG